jgi:uncharacterized protein YciI
MPKRFSLPLATLAVLATVTLAADLPMPAMATYQLGLLRRGPAWTATRTPATDSLQAGHMANIMRMAEEGVLVGAGPFLDGGDLRGVFIFRADSAAQVRPLADRDPAIRAGRLRLDLYTWIAPAGIGEPYRRISKQPGFRDSMIQLPFALLRPGPRASRSMTVDSIQIAHMQGIFRMMREGTLAAAGPLASDSLAGIFVFRGDTAAARRLANQDPAVRAGRLSVSMHPWFCAYGVMPGDTLKP